MCNNRGTTNGNKLFAQCLQHLLLFVHVLTETPPGHAEGLVLEDQVQAQDDCELHRSIGPICKLRRVQQLGKHKPFKGLHTEVSATGIKTSNRCIFWEQAQ